MINKFWASGFGIYGYIDVQRVGIGSKTSLIFPREISKGRIGLILLFMLWANQEAKLSRSKVSCKVWLIPFCTNRVHIIWVCGTQITYLLSKRLHLGN